MLILTRKPGQTIRIGDSIRVKVLAIKDHQVRLGIDAPVNVEVHREEVMIARADRSAQPQQKETADEERRSENREEEIDH